MRAFIVTIGGPALVLALLGGWSSADRLSAQAAEVIGDLVTHGPTLGAQTLHPSVCVTENAAPHPGGIDLIDKAHAATVRVTPTDTLQGLQLEVLLAPAAGGATAGGAARSVVFEMRDCKELHSRVEDGKSWKDAQQGDAHGHLELQCQAASGDGIVGKVQFSHCR
ncbi:MAG: hypothetical protein JOZ15_03210 [Acidobacteria bacterium]|nr:hypothetical protein [Acidobacteriota bacterium]